MQASTSNNQTLSQAQSLQLMKDEYRERIQIKDADNNGLNNKQDSSFTMLRVKDQLFDIETNSSGQFENQILRKKA